MADNWLVNPVTGLSTVTTFAGKEIAAVQYPKVLLYDSAGNELLKAEDAPHASGDMGIQALGVRKDTAAATAGTDGDYMPAIFDATGRQWVNTELPDAAALGDAMGNPTAPMVGAALLGYDCANYARLRTTGWNGDGLGSLWALAVGALGHTWNGVSVDRQRGNVEGTLLASAARTATLNSGNQTNHNSQGVIVILNVTAASGSGGLTVTIWGIDPVTGSSYQVTDAPTAILATGRYAYELCPGSSAAAVTGSAARVRQRTSARLPRTWYAEVAHGDATSYTYSLGYALLV